MSFFFFASWYQLSHRLVPVHGLGVGDHWVIICRGICCAKVASLLNDWKQPLSTGTPNAWIYFSGTDSAWNWLNESVYPPINSGMINFVLPVIFQWRGGNLTPYVNGEGTLHPEIDGFYNAIDHLTEYVSYSGTIALKIYIFSFSSPIQNPNAYHNIMQHTIGNGLKLAGLKIWREAVSIAAVGATILHASNNDETTYKWLPEV